MLLEEIGAKLAADGKITSGFSLFRDQLPDSPDKVIALYETGGIAADRFLPSGPTDDSVEHPGVQVVVRGVARDRATPRAALEVIYQAMLNWGAFTASGVHYMGATPLQGPFLFRRDGNERVLYAVNFILDKELSPAS